MGVLTGGPNQFCLSGSTWAAQITPQVFDWIIDITDGLDVPELNHFTYEDSMNDVDLPCNL